VAGLLQAAQRHDLHQIADMQAVRRAVEADITGHDLLSGRLVQCLEIGALVEVAAFDQGLEEQ